MNNDSNITKQIFLTATLLEKKGDVVFSAFGLTIKTHEILMLIQEGVCTTKELAQKMSLKPAGITQKTKVLEKNGFISRKVKKSDMRSWKFVLTTKGTETLGKTFPINEKVFKRLYSSFSESEKNIVSKVLIEVIEHLDKLTDSQIREFISNKRG